MLWYTCMLLAFMHIVSSSLVSLYSGPSLLLVLSRYEAIQGWRGMMGAVDPAEAKEADPNWWEGKGNWGREGRVHCDCTCCMD